MLLGASELLLDRTSLGGVGRRAFPAALLLVVPGAQRSQIRETVVVAWHDVVDVRCGRVAASTRLCERGALPSVSPQDFEPDLGPVLR